MFWLKGEKAKKKKIKRKRKRKRHMDECLAGWMN